MGCEKGVPRFVGLRRLIMRGGYLVLGCMRHCRRPCGSSGGVFDVIDHVEVPVGISFSVGQGDMGDISGTQGLFSRGGTW